MGIWDATHRDGSHSTVTADTRAQAIVLADRTAQAALQHIQRTGNSTPSSHSFR